MKPRKPVPRRSGCPLNATLEALGDRWSLLIVRDMLFNGATTYREFLASEEAIATNILANRLKLLEKQGIIAKRRDPADARRWIYTLAPKGLDLAPVLIELVVWGARYHQTQAPTAVLRKMTTHREAFITGVRAGARKK
jgi:DNA-binding HxlR family transcriptional regulator